MSLSKNKKIKILLEKKFKEKMSMNNFEIFAKPNKTGKRVPFHQDNFYWNIKNDKAANVWIALNKVDKTNGGLIYYKGSHKLGLKTHSASNIPGSSQEIKAETLKKINLELAQPKLNPGDCIIHHCNVIHGSKANKSNRARLAIAIRFISKNAKIDKKRMNDLEKDYGINNFDAIFETFFAYQIPNRCKNLEVPKSLVNLMRFSLNCAENLNLEYLEDYKFLSHWDIFTVNDMVKKYIKE